MKTVKGRIVTGIVTAALAIVPFTGTGIDTVDKNLTKSTAITASAGGVWITPENVTPGIYIVVKSFNLGGIRFVEGHYITVDSNGRSRGVDVTSKMNRHPGPMGPSPAELQFVRG